MKNYLISPSPAGNLPVIQKLVAAYKQWHQFLPHFPKTSRYTLGEKIDALFITLIELIFTAGYLYKIQKLPYVQKATIKLDVLKFFLRASWEIKALDNKKFICLSEKLDEVGRMFGGWLKHLNRQNPATQGREK